MEKLIESLITSAPGTAAVVIVVYFFTKYMKSRDADHRQLYLDNLEERKACRSALEHNARVSTTTTVEVQKNILATHLNTEAVKSLTSVINSLKENKTETKTV